MFSSLVRLFILKTVSYSHRRDPFTEAGLSTAEETGINDDVGRGRLSTLF